MEYPGYGLCQEVEAPNCDVLLENAQLLLDFLMNTLEYSPSDILLFGRSMGTGLATHLASTISSIGGLILLSPFTPLRDAVRTLLGKIPSLIVRDRFVNRTKVQTVKCPTLIIHGRNDTLIPCSHSQELFSRCTSTTQVKLVMPQNMTHNSFGDIYSDLLVPIKDFLLEYEIHPSQTRSQPLDVPQHYFAIPEFLL
jgi:fermentation-respiration switch protein FrsA (DUF1100 family)